MITQVRIAPVEKWCPEIRAVFEPLWAERREELEPSSGSILGIETTSMRRSPMCGGKEWRITHIPESIVATNPHNGEDVDPGEVDGWVCEHMLELD